MSRETQGTIQLNVSKDLTPELVNKYGGDAELVHLPEIGIKGNTHFPFADTNNEVIAKQLMDFLKEKKLNK